MLIGKTEVAKMLGKRTANVRPDELRDFPKPVIERPFPKWCREGEAKHRASIGFAGSCGSFAESAPEFQ